MVVKYSPREKTFMLPNQNNSDFDSTNLGGHSTTSDFEPIESISRFAIFEVVQMALDWIEVAKSYLAGRENEMDELDSLVQRAENVAARLHGCIDELEGIDPDLADPNLPSDFRLLKEWIADTADIVAETHQQLKKTEDEVELLNQPQRSGAQSKLLDSKSIPLGMRLAAEVGMAAALILQHFQYLLVEGYGVQIGDERWLWNPRWKWIQDHFPCMTEWEYRKARDYLEEQKLLKTCQPKKQQWNQTNYHTLDYERLKALILSIGESPPIDWRVPKQQRSHPPKSTPKTPATTTPVSKPEISGATAETLDFVDWRTSTNRLVTAHQSCTKQTSEQTFRSSSPDEISSVFPPQAQDDSTGGTQLKGVASLTPCPETPPLCCNHDTQEGGILTPPTDPAIASPVTQANIDCNDDVPSAATTPAPKPTRFYSRVQLEALARLGVAVNGGVRSVLRRASSQQIDDAITCFKEDKESWSKTDPLRKPEAGFNAALKQVIYEGRKPAVLVQPDPAEQLQQTLELWRKRWFDTPFPEMTRPRMFDDIKAAFLGGEIVVRDWNEGPVLGI